MRGLGLQIPNFDHPGVDEAGIWPTVKATAVAADRSGFDAVLVMDHFYQLPMLGPPDNRMLEAYSLLSAIGAVTERVVLSALVTGNTYRNPAVLAKTVTTLDHVSGGRAMLGIGSGWFELEHEAFGIEFGSFTDRFEKLEEALQIIGPMLRGERPSLDGKHYRANEATNVPAPIGDVPIMIGGAGEKKTLRFVARYAQASNLICDVEEIPRKLEVLAGHCAEEGRDRSDIAVSWLGSLCLAPTTEEAESDLAEFLTFRGMDWSSLGADDREAMKKQFIFGDPDTVAARVRDEVLGVGLDGLTVNMVPNSQHPERVALAGETLGPLFAS